MKIPRRLAPLMALLFFWPLVHVGGVAYLVVLGHWAWALAALYLLPPILCRLAFALLGRPTGRLGLWSRPGLMWWVSTQLQMIFNRFGFLEEILRILPVLYTNWLRLWGAQIGRGVFWSPRAWVLDRPYLKVGDHALVGAGVLLTSHLVLPDREGKSFDLVIADIIVGKSAMLGGYSGMSPGSSVADGETLPGTVFLAPFYSWLNNRRRAPVWRRSAQSGKHGQPPQT